MGIGGVTYTDGRGRKRNLDVNSLEDFKAQFDAVARPPRARVAPQLPAPGAQQAQSNAAPETMPGSAVVNTRSGLALKGEENDPTVPGVKVYGSVNGIKGYHTLDEIDPLAGGGRRVGHDSSAANDADDETPDGDGVQGFDGQGFAVPLASRIALTGGEDGVYTLYLFTRDLRFSNGRRAGGVSAESKREIGTIYMPTDDAADAPYYPYSVKMVSSDNAGNRLYGIYLPPNILYVADEQPDPAESLNAIQGMPAWYELPNGHQYGPVYLHITFPYTEESGSGKVEHEAEAEVVTAADEPGEHDMYIEIADIVDDGVVQKIVGTVVASTGKEGKKEEGKSIPGPFEPVHDATTGLLTGFTHCIYCAERQFVECGTDGEMEISGVTASTSGYVVLTLPHDAYASASANVIDNDNVSVAIENVLPMNDSDAVTKIPLYHVTAGVVDVDLRAVPTGVLAR